MTMTQEKIIAIAEENGWYVHIGNNGNNDKVIFEFSKFTPYGQDFNFQAEWWTATFRRSLTASVIFWMPSTPTARRIFGWDRTDTEKKVRHTT